MSRHSQFCMSSVTFYGICACSSWLWHECSLSDLAYCKLSNNCRLYSLFYYGDQSWFLVIMYRNHKYAAFIAFFLSFENTLGFHSVASVVFTLSELTLINFNFNAVTSNRLTAVHYGTDIYSALCVISYSTKLDYPYCPQCSWVIVFIPPWGFLDI